MFGYPLPRWLFIVGFVIIAAAGLGLANVAFAQKTVTVTDGAQTIRLHSPAGTVGEALRAAGLSFYPEDLIQPPANSPLESGAAITLTRALPVEVIEGGVTLLVRTHQRAIDRILLEAGKTVAPGDGVYVDGICIPTDQLNEPGPPPHTLLIQRARPVTVIDGATAQTITTAALTVGEALAEAQIPLYIADSVTPPLDAPLASELTITLQRSLPLTIEVDGRSLQTRARPQSSAVAEVLAEAGVMLLGEDYSIPALHEPPPTDNAPVRVVRVLEQIVTETKPLPYETQYQAVADLEIDNLQIVQAGAYGATATRVRVRYENGVEVSRTNEESWTAAAPRPRILGYGAKIVVRSLETPQGTLEYWRAVRMYATSYSAARAGTPRSAPWYGRTRSGKTLTVGMAAVDLRVMPLGARLYVPGYGPVTAEDTGGGVKGKMIDLGYDDWNFVNWHQYVTVYFLTPIPPADQIKWVIP